MGGRNTIPAGSGAGGAHGWVWGDTRTSTWLWGHRDGQAGCWVLPELVGRELDHPIPSLPAATVPGCSKPRVLGHFQLLWAIPGLHQRNFLLLSDPLSFLSVSSNSGSGCRTLAGMRLVMCPTESQNSEAGKALQGHPVPAVPNPRLSPAQSGTFPLPWTPPGLQTSLGSPIQYLTTLSMRKLGIYPRRSGLGQCHTGKFAFPNLTPRPAVAPSPSWCHNPAPGEVAPSWLRG